MKHYILVTRDTALWLVGPFASHDAAGDYGAMAEKRDWHEDPRWQTIELDYTYGLLINGPTEVTFG